MPRSTTWENNGKCLGKQRVHSKFLSVGKLQANVMFTRVHLQKTRLENPAPVNAAFTNSAKQKKTFRKTVCSLGVFERRKTAGEYHVFHSFTFNVIWLENLRQTPSLPTPANNRKTFRKTACSLGVFERKKIAGEYHVFLVLTIDTIRLENLRQTRR